MDKKLIKEKKVKTVLPEKKEEVLKPNRHDRRAELAFQKRLPQIAKKIAISNNLKYTKKEGRIAKQKHIDEVKARTAKRKGLKKLNKTK